MMMAAGWLGLAHGEVPVQSINASGVDPETDDLIKYPDGVRNMANDTSSLGNTFRQYDPV